MARGRGKTIDYKEWSFIPEATTTVSTDTTLVVSGSLAINQSLTVLRTRCPDLLIQMDATKQVGDFIRIAIGLGIFTQDVITLGASAMPDLADEANHPWLWWGEWTLRSEVAAGTDNLGTSVVRTSMDSKAMRRIKGSGFGMIWVAQTTGASGAPVVNISIANTRVLVGF